MTKARKPTFKGYTQADWDEVSDSPELTAADVKHARSGAEIFPELAAAARGRGRPKSEAPKVAVKIRVARDVLEAYKAAGPGYQTRMNDALRKNAPAGLLRGATTGLGREAPLQPAKAAQRLAASASNTRTMSAKKAAPASTSTAASKKSGPGHSSRSGTVNRSTSRSSSRKRPDQA